MPSPERPSRERPRHRFQPGAPNPLEDRVLLSAVPSRRVHPPRPGIAHVQGPRRVPPSQSGDLAHQADFVVDTVGQGRSLAYSDEVRNVGFHYAKLGVSHDTRKLGAAYVRAALKGDGKAINQINHSNLLKKVGNQFEALGRSKQVQRVGDLFTNFGRAVADRFRKVF